MRMLNSIVDIGTSESGQYNSNARGDKVLPGFTRFIKKAPIVTGLVHKYRKALEALVEVIEKDKTNEQRKVIFFVRDVLTYMMKENPEMLHRLRGKRQ